MINFFTEENVQAILEHADISREIVEEIFLAMTFGYDTVENIQTILDHADKSQIIYSAMISMAIGLTLNQASFNQICQRPNMALYYAEDHGGIKEPYNRGAESFVKIRQASRLFYLGTRNNADESQSPLQLLPNEMLVKIASYCGENSTLDSKTCDAIANRALNECRVATM